VAERGIADDGDGAVTGFNVVLSRDALIGCLGRVHRVVPRRSTIPILANVLLRNSSKTLAITATDLDIEVVASVEVASASKSAITVPATTLYDIARKLPEGSEVSLKADDATLTVACGRSRFKLPVLPVSDFPDMAPGELPTRFDIAAGDLRRLIEKTEFAISTEETRYYLNGIYLHVENGKLRGVATDGHRLALVDLDLPAGAADMSGVIIPRKTVGEIQRLLDGAEAVTVELSDSKIRVTCGDAVLTSKLIDGTFPDYRRVIPQGNDKTLEIDRAEFHAAIDRVATVSSEKGKATKLTLSKGNLDLSVTNPDSGSASEEVEAGYDAEPLEIGFNARYLLDIVAQIEGDTVVMDLDQAGSPTIIKSKDGNGALYVLMPMRI